MGRNNGVHWSWLQLIIVYWLFFIVKINLLMYQLKKNALRIKLNFFKLLTSCQKQSSGFFKDFSADFLHHRMTNVDAAFKKRKKKKTFGSEGSIILLKSNICWCKCGPSQAAARNIYFGIKSLIILFTRYNWETVKCFGLTGYIYTW